MGKPGKAAKKTIKHFLRQSLKSDSSFSADPLIRAITRSRLSASAENGETAPQWRDSGVRDTGSSFAKYGLLQRRAWGKLGTANEQTFIRICCVADSERGGTVVSKARDNSNFLELTAGGADTDLQCRLLW